VAHRTQSGPLLENRATTWAQGNPVRRTNLRDVKMSIFDRDRIGTSVFCKVIDNERSVSHGYVKWTHAKKGLVVGDIEVLGYGRVKGPWIVEAVDVSLTA